MKSGILYIALDTVGRHVLLNTSDVISPVRYNPAITDSEKKETTSKVVNKYGVIAPCSCIPDKTYA